MRAFALAVALVFAPSLGHVAASSELETSLTARSSHTPQPVPVVHYGAGIAVADALILGSAALSAPVFIFGDHNDDSVGSGLLYGGIIAYPLVGPLIHLAHRNASSAAKSVGVRVASRWAAGLSSRRWPVQPKDRVTG